MPTDFWRNDQQLNIFRTKSCQRLARDGVCGWRSQCQFSHNLEWPRRQPRRYHYSPEMCPNIRIIEDTEGGTERIENKCTAGQRCPWAHSKEEVLFHPDIFKTSLCEEHTNNVGSKNTRNTKKSRCHRYYCPFAHGSDELRTSTLPLEKREKCLRAMEVFPSDVCCVACCRHWLTAANLPQQKCPEGSAPLGFESQGAPQTLQNNAPGLQPPFPGFGPNLWDVLSTVPNTDTLFLKAAQDNNFAKNAAKDRPMQSPIQKPTADPFSVPYKPQELNQSLFQHGDVLRVSKMSNDSPAFIDLASAGPSLGHSGYGQSPTKSSPISASQQRDLLGEFYYAML